MRGADAVCRVALAGAPPDPDRACRSLAGVVRRLFAECGRRGHNTVRRGRRPDLAGRLPASAAGLPDQAFYPQHSHAGAHPHRLASRRGRPRQPGGGLADPAGGLVALAASTQFLGLSGVYGGVLHGVCFLRAKLWHSPPQPDPGCAADGQRTGLRCGIRRTVVA